MCTLRSFRLCLLALALLLIQQSISTCVFAYPHHVRETSPSTPTSTHGKIISITDGDTLTVLFADGLHEKIRLVDVDAPEKTQPFGADAKQFLINLALMHPCTIDRRGHDRYGRTLATVYLDDLAGTDSTNPTSDLNAALLSAGYAWIYHGKTAVASYYDLESSARLAHRGLWSSSESVAPWDFRKMAREHTQR